MHVLVGLLGRKMERSPRKETPGGPCSPILSVAVKALFEKNIPVVEYGQQINRRCGDPVVLMVGTDASRVSWHSSYWSLLTFVLARRMGSPR